MIKKIAITIFLLSAFFSVKGQAVPGWLDVDFRREKFPENNYFTGFASGEISGGRSLQEVTQKMITDAKADLSRKIRVQITTSTQSEMTAKSVGWQYRESESFINRAETESSAEVVGIKTESYYDTRTRIIYAFAHVNRYELIGYHKGNLNMNLSQAEGLLKTAKDLESAGEKAKARQQCEAASPLLEKVRVSQDMLTAISPGISSNDLQQVRTETIHNQLTQLHAQLAQAVLVFVVNKEYLFDEQVNIVANQLKAELAKSGCSFVDNAKKADFKLTINVSTRHANTNNNFVFCIADTQVELFDNRKQKIVYSDMISQRSGDTSQEKAARRAMTDVVKKVSEKLKPWIEN